MKKAIIIICIMAALLVTGFYVFYVTRWQSLVTGNVNDIGKIIIVKDRTIEEGIEKSLSPSDAEVLFNELKRLRTKTVAHPNHIQSMQNDPIFIIEIHYNDGSADVIYTSETLLRLYRFIETTGSDGDPGYILSDENERTKSLLEEYFQ